MVYKFNEYNDFFDTLEYLIEGINIDYKTKTVTIDLSHENGVDTGLIINPSYYKINNYDVISIFKRKENIDKSDGNPLIHALKCNKGWKINNDDIIKLLKQFIRISEKIKNHYDTIITIPSKATLNIEFLYRLNKIIKADDVIEDVIRKVTASEVLMCAEIDKKLSKNDFNDIEDRIRDMIVNH
jgi:hypothetical protein